MIPHIVIFYKQFDQPLAKQTKTVKLSVRFFSRFMGISGTILYRFGSRLFCRSCVILWNVHPVHTFKLSAALLLGGFLDLFLMIKGGSFMSADELNIQQYQK